MKTDQLRQILIDGTIRVIASEGLGKASTKQIGKATNLNEAYIYRCFNNKEDMFLKAFNSLDDELLSVTLKHMPIFSMETMDFDMRCRMYFAVIWQFLLGNKEKCLTFVRYFYTPDFVEYAAKDHELRYKPLVEQFRVAFRDEADVWMILNHILNVMLDFAVKVHNGLMHDDERYSEHVFRVIYASVKQYFRW
jgi:AcrR family transcriptional regulator